MLGRERGDGIFALSPDFSLSWKVPCVHPRGRPLLTFLFSHILSLHPSGLTPYFGAYHHLKF